MKESAVKMISEIARSTPSEKALFHCAVISAVSWHASIFCCQLSSHSFPSSSWEHFKIEISNRDICMCRVIASLARSSECNSFVNALRVGFKKWVGRASRNAEMSSWRSGRYGLDGAESLVTLIMWSWRARPVRRRAVVVKMWILYDITSASFSKMMDYHTYENHAF